MNYRWDEIQKQIEEYENKKWYPLGIILNDAELKKGAKSFLALDYFSQEIEKITGQDRSL